MRRGRLPSGRPPLQGRLSYRSPRRLRRTSRRTRSSQAYDQGGSAGPAPSPVEVHAPPGAGGDARPRGRRRFSRGRRTDLRRRLGYLPQEPGFYPHFTLFELVDYVAILKELTDRRERHREVRRVLAEVGLADRAGTKVRKLSGGMKQRLALAQALLGAPDLLILDEPTVGLDPEQRMRFRALVSRLGESRTVLLSTHQAEDVAALCERVIVMNRGRVVFQGTPAELATAASGQGWLSDAPPSGSHLFWRTADGRYRTLGVRPPGAAPAVPAVEDGGRAAALAGMGGLLVIVSVSLVLRGPYWPWLYPEEENWEIVHHGWLAVLPPVLAALNWAGRDLR
ncbi:ATP-binding cassette domain-containing protein [Streptosporangium canum]|uniref:ATP-binding cassette domain-containing protein n=1 Tax=Streptosporangium canum TaxID=324952 RepID=UPI000AB23130